MSTYRKCCLRVAMDAGQYAKFVLCVAFRCHFWWLGVRKLTNVVAFGEITGYQVLAKALLLESCLARLWRLQKSPVHASPGRDFHSTPK